MSLPTTGTSVTNTPRIESLPIALPIGATKDMKDIGCKNDGGKSTQLARIDHVHKGLHSVKADDGTERFGDLTLMSGQGVSIVDVTGEDDCFPVLQFVVVPIAYRYMTVVESSQSIPDDTFTAVLFDSTESTLNVDLANNSRFTPQVAGYYLVIFQVSINNGGEGGIREIFMRPNGTTTVWARQTTPGGSSPAADGLNISAERFFNGTTDYVQLFAYQNSGSALNISTGDYEPRASISFRHSQIID